MTERERLINLLFEWGNKENDGVRVENIADYLISNGVIVPPCKIGDTVYYVYHGWMSDSYVTEATVCGISAEIYERKNKCVYLKIIYKDLDGNSDRAESIFGSRVFLTEKEAEIKLKELRK